MKSKSPRRLKNPHRMGKKKSGPSPWETHSTGTAKSFAVSQPERKKTSFLSTRKRKKMHRHSIKREHRLAFPKESGAASSRGEEKMGRRLRQRKGPARRKKKGGGLPRVLDCDRRKEEKEGRIFHEDIGGAPNQGSQREKKRKARRDENPPIPKKKKGRGGNAREGGGQWTSKGRLLFLRGEGKKMQFALSQEKRGGRRDRFLNKKIRNLLVPTEGGRGEDRLP